MLMVGGDRTAGHPKCECGRFLPIPNEKMADWAIFCPCGKVHRKKEEDKDGRKTD